MGRSLKIVVYVAILFLAYLWIATVAKSCNKQATADSNNNTEMVDGIADVDSDEFEDDLFEDEEGSDLDETATTDGMGGGTFIDEDSNSIDYTEVDEIIENNNASSTKASVSSTKRNTSSKYATSSSYSGKYMLLAGSYLIEDNAQIMIKKLKKLGYANAEMVIFDMSQYHAVCAGRYTSLSSAQQESGALKRKGIDNYVHTKQ